MSNISRRNFISKSMTGLAGIAIAPGLYGINRSASDTVRLGFIGLGRQAMFLLRGFISMPGVEVVAGSDVYGIKRERFEKQVRDFYSEAKKKGNVKTYEKYQELLDRQDIDAVVISTPDHWHALMAIDACRAGKDVYLEKPLTFTIREGQKLRLAVRDHNRILAVGSQQRSDPNFQHAVRMVQEGKIGRIQKLNACIGPPPTPYDLPKEDIPKDLNWDLWLGPNPYVHYNPRLNPPISLNPVENEKYWAEWRYFKETGGGFTTDWGAHMFDIAQWGLGMDKSGPVEIIPAGYMDFTHLTFLYSNGAVMTEEPFDEKETKGVKFWGNDGWIEVSRGHYNASDPSLFPETSDEGEGPYETRVSHHLNFIESVRSRKEPVVPVEIGHRTCTVCNLGNIAYELGRPLKWNASTESFIDDDEADKFMHRNYRHGYKL